MYSRLSYVVIGGLVTVLAGCLPYSCRQTEPRALYPSDSLSQEIAARVSPQQLELVRATSGTSGSEMVYPTSIVRGPNGKLFVSDAKQNAVYVFDRHGRSLYRFRASSFAYPFLTGFRGDTLVVLSRGNSQLQFVVDSTVARSISVPEGPGAMAVSTDSSIFYKVVEDDPWIGPNIPGYITRITRAGDTTAPHVELPGPFWRHRGFMRMWGDTLVSLSGYRPVIDLISADGTLDTLALRGFDSPMLARSRGYIKGSVDTAPVLTSSAVPRDSVLYVMNLRAHRLRIDVYDREGQLRTIYQEPAPTNPETPDIFPMDFAVYRNSAGALRFAVVMYEPSAGLRVYGVE